MIRLIRNEIYRIMHKKSTIIFLIIALIYVLITNIIYKKSDLLNSSMYYFDEYNYYDYEFAKDYINDNSPTEANASEYAGYKSYLDAYELAINYDKESWQYEKFMEEARIITAKLQGGHPGYNALYNVFFPISLKSMTETVNKLNIMPFDKNLGERNAALYIEPVEKMLREKNLLVKSDGAEVIIVKKDTDNAPMPPVMFYNSRGAVPYDATDIMALYYRKITDNPDKIIYLTDIRQKLHFEQLFRVAEITGLFPPENLEHIGYGTINGSDGKPFKTRDGNAAGLNDIIDMINEAVKKRVIESGKNLPKETIDTIALAALKFNDLMHDLRSDYIFDPESVTSFEGRTGPYILYTAVRLNSVLKKAGIKKESKLCSLSEEERNLLIEILDFERTVQSAFDNRATDIIANYAYDLCQLINTFYHNCPILREGINEETKAQRLTVTRIARDTLATAIDLMGLKIPEEM